MVTKRFVSIFLGLSLRRGSRHFVSNFGVMPILWFPFVFPSHSFLFDPSPPTTYFASSPSFITQISCPRCFHFCSFAIDCCWLLVLIPILTRFEDLRIRVYGGWFGAPKVNFDLFFDRLRMHRLTRVRSSNLISTNLFSCQASFFALYFVVWLIHVFTLCLTSYVNLSSALLMNYHFLK